MTTLLLSIGLVVLFVIGLISPRLAGKIERKTNQEAGWLKRMSNWFWDPITWWAKKSIEFTQKAIDTATRWGKKTHKKM
jgi:hypothetical protein